MLRNPLTIKQEKCSAQKNEHASGALLPAQDYLKRQVNHYVYYVRICECLFIQMMG